MLAESCSPDFIYLESFESKIKTSDWLNHNDVANLKFCYFQSYKIPENVWLILTLDVPVYRLFVSAT